MILGFLRQLTIAVACTTGQSAVAAPTFTLSRGCRPTNTPHCAHASHAAAVRCCTASGHRHNKCISVCQPTAGRSAGIALAPPRACARTASHLTGAKHHPSVPPIARPCAHTWSSRRAARLAVPWISCQRGRWTTVAQRGLRWLCPASITTQVDEMARPAAPTRSRIIVRLRPPP